MIWLFLVLCFVGGYAGVSIQLARSEQREQAQKWERFQRELRQMELRQKRRNQLRKTWM